MIYLNGEYLAEQAIHDLSQDRGLLLGDGLFETIKVVDRQAEHLDLHLQRLQTGAEYLHIPWSEAKPTIAEAISHLLEINQLTDAAVRITLTRGSSKARGIAIPDTIKPNLFMQVAPLMQPKQNYSASVITDYPINEHSPLCAFKTLNYLENIMARKLAKQKGADFAIRVNTKSQLVSCCVANLYLLINDVLYTPPLSAGALPGIIRQVLLRQGHYQDYELVEAELTPSDLVKAEAILMSNSLLGMQTIDNII